MKSLCDLRTDYLEKEFGPLVTCEVIITGEREFHIRTRHPQDYPLFLENGEETLVNPDMVIKDTLNEGTVFFVKKIQGTNLNIVVRLSLSCEKSEYKNSVMTAYRIRDKNLVKLLRRHNDNILYKKE